MAMPILIEQPEVDLAELVRLLAERMAASVGCEIGNVLARTKSRSWMLGKLRRVCPQYSDDHIRSTIAALSRVHRPPALPDVPVVEEAPRRALFGLEPSTFPIWLERATTLGGIIVYPMRMDELIRRSEARLKWGRNLTIQATSAAEDHGEAYYDGNFWLRTPERILMATAKTKTKRVSRRLPVQLRPEDQAELTKRIADIDAEKESLEAELAEQTRTLKGRIKERIEARERAIESLKTGREVQVVECEERWQYDARSVTTVRKDTGAVVESREMTPEELQLSLGEATPS